MLSLLFALLLSLDRHDYVHPSLSPDGKQLAVGRVYVRKDGSETTDVVLIDLATKKSRELLGRKEAEAHEVYEIYLTRIEWIGKDRLTIDLSDGDVGGTTLTYDATRRKVIAREEHSEDDDGGAQAPAMSERDAALLTTIEIGRDEYAQLRQAGATRLVFVRSHITNEESNTRIFEVAGDTLKPLVLHDRLDDFSFSADGRRVAISYWKNGRRAVKVIDR